MPDERRSRSLVTGAAWAHGKRCGPWCRPRTRWAPKAPITHADKVNAIIVRHIAEADAAA
jgi:hypothetical protein